MQQVQGGERWILPLHDVPPEVLAQLPRVRERIAAVRDFRQKRKCKSTLKLAETPTLWQVNVIPAAPFLVIPEVSSERREYAPSSMLAQRIRAQSWPTPTIPRHKFVFRPWTRRE
ncbi:MAG: hypothetical protein OXC05_14575 [Halieaceae bacterium]|nr:hypothetical protein [Halieaceae bacterium]